mgnify:FL=1
MINHLMSILIIIFLSGYHGKTTDFAKNSSCHRTTIANFLNSGKWDESLLSDTLKRSVIEIIYSEAARTGKPVFCIVDDTIASKTKPSSRALHPIEDAYFHQSHLKGKQDYGHQAVSVMLSCNGIVLNYAFVLYNKLSELAAELSVTHKNFDLVTVKGRNYYVYRYEGNLNGIENAIVLFSYPEKAFGKPKALRAFLCMDVSLSTNEILDNYVCRWPIEVFFRQCKDKLALDSYQIRSAQGIRRYWLIMSFAHYMCVVGTGKVCPFETAYRRISDIIQMEKYLTLYQCARECIGFDSFVKVVA